MGKFSPQDVLDFWFGEPGSEGAAAGAVSAGNGREAARSGANRKAWFAKEPAFDQAVQARFAQLYQDAIKGRLDGWRDTAAGALALTVVLDQFPHHLFRDTARAFEADAKALALAEEAVGKGFDQQVLPVQRVFFYLPFEHSEDMARQDRAVALFARLASENPGFRDYLDYAHQHREVIARFGRFPHRNELLGRASTSAEREFLKQPGSRF